MKKLVVVFAVLAVASACHFNRTTFTPAPKMELVGMSVTEYYSWCRNGEHVLNDWEAIGRVGECTERPSEYVLFKAGVITEAYDSEKFSSLLAQACSARTARPLEQCLEIAKQGLAEQEAIKDQIDDRLRAQRYQQQAQQRAEERAAANAELAEKRAAQSAASASLGILLLALKPTN